MIKKKNKDLLYNNYHMIMADMRQELKSSSRLASRLIHSPIISTLGNTLISTVFRPLPLLFASVSGIVTILAVTLLLITSSYQPSSTDVAIAIIIGWIIGFIYDAVREVVTRLR